METGEPVGQRVVDVVEVGEVRRADRDEQSRKALPRFRGGDGALLERLEEHVLGPERQLPDLVDQEESTVRLQQLSRLEDERAHRVADLLELAQVDVAGQMVGEYLGAALQTGV